MNLYRVKYGIDNGGASWADWKYYESLSHLQADLLIAHLEIAMEKERGFPRQILSAWRKFYKKNDDTLPRTKNIYAVERVENDEWVAVEYKFYPPEIEIT